MKFDNFRKIIDTNPAFLRVDMDNFGELFLNPDLPKIIAYAYKKKIGLSCNVGSNLNYATKEMLEALVKYSFLNLTCSIDAATSKTYEIYRVGGNVFFQDYIEVINSEKLDYARKMLLGEAGPRQDIPCVKCEIYLNMKKVGVFLSRDGIDNARPKYYHILSSIINSRNKNLFYKYTSKMIKDTVWILS